jgi:hypothetical protein|tara:strand:- start:4066 stop:4824 length:759 start_codon:yes stop_codon:yes gene_type:complete
MKKTQKFIDKAYRLIGEKAPLSYMLASRHSKRSPLLYFDEDKGVNRPLRYARNQKTPFEDEQDGNAVLEPIVFEDGMLFVPKQNQVLQEFLHYHPSNGRVYEVIDKARDASQELEIVEQALDAQIVAKGLKGDKLLAVARVLIGAGVDRMSTIEIRRDVLVYAQNNPFDFLETINDPMLDLTNDVVQFFNNSFLVFKNNGKDVYFNLPKNKTKLLTVPFGEDAYYIVASFFQGDEGLETYKLLVKRLKSTNE